MTIVRNSVLSGSWYTADSAELSASIDSYLNKADKTQMPAGRPYLAVTPHAGHTYCGSVAGKLFGLLGDFRPENIFILAPNHRSPITEIALPREDAFATPLGEVPLNKHIIDTLSQKSGFEVNHLAHAEEHAVEIVLPFMQRTWPNSVPPIIPMLVPMSGKETLKEAGATLQQVLGDNDLLLVSSDFTHYGAAFNYVPFKKDVPMSLERLDAGAILKILAGDADGLWDYGRQTGITMCGLPACCVALGLGPPSGYEAALLDYSRSGDRDGDYSLSVSYASLLLTSGNEE